MPLIMMVRNFGNNTLRNIMFGIDFAIYHLLSFLIQVVFDIADIPADTFQTLNEAIIKKIYLIVAVYMLFKITISLLTYLVNPDAMSDKQQGIGKLVSRVITSFVMLIAAPTMFTLLLDLQGPILRTMPKLILNVAAYKEDSNTTVFNSSDELADTGTNISWRVINTFFYRNPECVGEDTKLAYSEPDWDDWVSNSNEGSLPANILDLSIDHVNDACTSRSGGGSIYRYGYTPFISTIAGGFLCFVLIGIAVMVAVRMFKLIILQALAPIPIIGYMDPKSSKDGSFNVWLKTYFTTWLELFINLAIVYIIIFIVSNIILGGTGSAFVEYTKDLPARRKGFLTTFVVIGLFSFAKQAPKFIMDIIGVKSNGNFAKALGISTAVAGGTAAAIGTGAKNIGQMANDYKNADSFGQGAWATMKGIGRGFRNTGMGAWSALTGSSAAYNSDKGGMKAGWDTMSKMNKSSFGMYGDSLQNRMDALDKESKLSAGILDYAEKKAMKSDKTTGRTDSGISGNYRKYSSTYQAAINNGAGVYKKYIDEAGNIIDDSKYNQFMAAGANPSDYKEYGSFFKFDGQEINLADAERIGQDLLDANTQDYIDRNPNEDGAITQQTEYFNKKYKKYAKSGETSTYKRLKKSKGQTAGEKFETQNRMRKKAKK